MADDYLERFFEFARPLADACHEPGLNMRLRPPSAFKEFLAALEQDGHQDIEQTLLLLLDEFCQLEQRSYDELYLWAIVHLSCVNLAYAETFWPLVLTLDLRFRAEPWRRPADAALSEQPYRLTELVLYYYVETTQPPDPEGELLLIEVYLDEPQPAEPAPVSPYPSLATVLRRLLPCLDAAQAGLLRATLAELARQERRPAFGDAHGLLLKLAKEAAVV